MAGAVLYRIYIGLQIAASVVLLPFFLYKCIRRPSFFKKIRQRLGFIADTSAAGGASPIWIHAASLGELRAAEPIVQKLVRQDPQVPLVLSTVTETGYQLARTWPSVRVLYFPWDLPYVTARLLRRYKPQLIILVETELWPNFLYSARKAGIPVIMMNGRISERSMRKYMRVAPLTRYILRSVRVFLMQSRVDSSRIRQMGVASEKVYVTGNTKYDREIPYMSRSVRADLWRQLGITEQTYPVLVAGSTHKGEERWVLEAFLAIRRIFPLAKLILAPRYAEDCAFAVQEAAAQGVELVRRSTRLPVQATQGVVVDTTGELGLLYGLADIAFVGGSLLPVGGHNILEPAAWGKAVLTGPYMFHFSEICELFTKRRACMQVADGEEFVTRCVYAAEHRQWCRQMAAEALRIIKENRGTTDKNIAVVQRVLEAGNDENTI